MARIAGINIPQNKVVSIALTYIHGIILVLNIILIHLRIWRLIEYVMKYESVRDVMKIYG